jgi:tetratricopeptide (TPR) repeat protein
MGAACGVVAVVTHELMDFGTEMPGVAFPTVVALGLVAGRVAAKDRQCPRAAPARAWPVVGVWAGALLLALWAVPRTLDADDLALAAAARAGKLDEAQLTAAVARHPADDYLELVAARNGIVHHDARAMKHLNRAIELHPANWQAHQLAARMLAGVGRPGQAAIEYRLALEHGMIPDYKELVRVLGMRVIDAVPQEPERLIELGRNLGAIGRPAEAERACARAADLAPRRETALAACVSMALAIDSKPLMQPTARALAAAANDADSFALAAQALQRSGAASEAAALITRALQRQPDDANLVLVAARLRIEAGDLVGARALLGRNSERTGFSLAEQLKIEELAVEAAERAGDGQAAVLARARARMLQRRLRETSYNSGQE